MTLHLSPHRGLGRIYLWLVRASSSCQADPGGRRAAAEKIVHGTTLCRFSWRIFFTLLYFALMAGCVGGSLFGIGWIVVHYWNIILMFAGLAVGGILLTMILYWIAYVFFTSTFDRSPGLIRVWWHGKKNRICPPVVFDRADKGNDG